MLSFLFSHKHSYYYLHLAATILILVISWLVLNVDGKVEAEGNNLNINDSMVFDAMVSTLVHQTQIAMTGQPEQTEQVGITAVPEGINIETSIPLAVTETPIFTATPTLQLTNFVKVDGNPEPPWYIWNAVAGTGRMPNRTIEAPAKFTLHKWWLRLWESGEVVCELWPEHDGAPDDAEVIYFCGSQLYEMWKTTPPCPYAGNAQAKQCPGLYMQEISQYNGERTKVYELEAPTVSIAVAGCTQQALENNLCESKPNLVISAQEPLPGESITKIIGAIDGRPFECYGELCVVTPEAVSSEQLIVYWAESSYGDSSYVHAVMVRIAPSEVHRGMWRVDLLGDSYSNNNTNIASCSDVWGVMPDPAYNPLWLTTPRNAEAMKTDSSYYYLAGMLIRNGVVNASGCPRGGMETTVTANHCGVEASSTVLASWQNQFDDRILVASKEAGIPAFLLKNLLARESQFWPGVYQRMDEAGLGQLTEGGADTLLMWNKKVYEETCGDVLHPSMCQRGYNNLSITNQEKLRGTLINDVNASCPECQYGVHLERADYSINIFAETIKASCEQTGRVMYGVLADSLNGHVSYEDLWKLTLLNYNAGPGCLANAVSKVNNMQSVITWDDVVMHLEPACQGAIGYVHDISTVEVHNTAW